MNLLHTRNASLWRPIWDKCSALRIRAYRSSGAKVNLLSRIANDSSYFFIWNKQYCFVSHQPHIIVLSKFRYLLASASSNLSSLTRAYPHSRSGTCFCSFAMRSRDEIKLVVSRNRGDSYLKFANHNKLRLVRTLFTFFLSGLPNNFWKISALFTFGWIVLIFFFWSQISNSEGL